MKPESKGQRIGVAERSPASRQSGLRVICRGRPPWGGHVPADDGAAKVTVFFLGGGKRTLDTPIAECTGDDVRSPSEVCDRLWDLHPVIKSHDYHPAFHGSCSIKTALLAYCEHDTLAMVELRKALRVKACR